MRCEHGLDSRGRLSLQVCVIIAYSRFVQREHGSDSRGRLSLQVCAIIAYSLGQTTLGEQIGSWGGQARFHRPPLAEELFVSILGGGTKMLPADTTVYSPPKPVSSRRLVGAVG